ncbi:MAG: 4Fe-4S dicluster domain-containing protein [Candidatus Aerophobetes bacterium]|nr:4Fe-4S dicluster domain-containing protein [Candidatus Aerophobetes bacterium]
MSENEEKVVRVNELDSNFKYEIQKEPGGENITRCLACGTCTASCPVREVNEKYNPRKIIRMALLGMKERVLSSDFIWLCSSCYTCYERCPQDVRITELMNAMKNIAVKEGHIHPSFTAQLDALNSHGRLYEIGEFDNKKRVKQNLPQIEESAEDTKKLFKEEGVDKLVTAKEEE